MILINFFFSTPPSFAHPSIPKEKTIIQSFIPIACSCTFRHVSCVLRLRDRVGDIGFIFFFQRPVIDFFEESVYLWRKNWAEPNTLSENLHHFAWVECVLQADLRTWTSKQTELQYFVVKSQWCGIFVAKNVNDSCDGIKLIWINDLTMAKPWTVNMKSKFKLNQRFKELWQA